MHLAALPFALALLPLIQSKDIHVEVGAGAQLLFEPKATFADPGDKVIFTFTSKNHSVTESSFADPCGPKAGGHNSGFMPVAMGATDFPTFTIDVPDTNPIWIHCAQKNPKSHCGDGMVFAINCGPDGAPNSFTNFEASARRTAATPPDAPAAPAAPAAPDATYTAAYGGATIPPPPAQAEVTKTVVLDPSSSWLTTYTSYAGSPEPTPAAAEGTTHTVVVGGPGKLLFEPSSITALPRDKVVFQFRQKNHTVTQSSFPDPCRRLTVNGQAIGFDSGFMPVADGATDFPTWTLTINDTSPIWGYCRQKLPSSHCGAGMVFAINSDESGPRNFKAFSALAQQLNGTAAAQIDAPSPTPTSSAVSLKASGALSLVFAAAVALLF